MRLIAAFVLVLLGGAPPAFAEERRSVIDRATFKGLPRAGMSCAAYLAASSTHVSADPSTGESPVEAAQRRQAFQSLDRFVRDVSARTPGLPEVVPNEGTMSVASRYADLDETARVLGRVTSATERLLAPSDDERIVAFQLRGLDAIRSFDEARLRELSGYVELSSSPMVESAKPVSVVGYAAPVAAVVGALWNLAAGTPVTELTPYLMVPLLMPVHFLAADRKFPTELERYLEFRDGEVDGPAWHFESLTASLPPAVVGALLRPESSIPVDGEFVDGDRLFHSMLVRTARTVMFQNRLLSESTAFLYGLTRVFERFSRDRCFVSIDRLLTYDHRGVEGPRWELTVVLRLGVRPPRPRAPRRVREPRRSSSWEPLGAMELVPIPVRTRQ
jgi:hypothetical protein